MLRNSQKIFSSFGFRDVKVADFYKVCANSGISYFTGVPDSLLKDFCAYVSDHSTSKQHVISANEGNAVALAAGYHLATGRLPLVYTQNSGYGNMVNPLLSLAHSGVYGIPMIIMVGWRGEPGIRDEPQHYVMGKLQAGIIQAMDISCTELPTTNTEALGVLRKAALNAMTTSSPHVLLVRKDTFCAYSQKKLSKFFDGFPLSREEAVRIVLKTAAPNAAFVGTTGFLSRELFEIRAKEYNKDHSMDFLCVGSMGHACSIADGIANQQSTRPVVCLDGDGAALMHLGSMRTNSAPNLTHIIISNGMHESVGGQPIAGSGPVDFCAAARAFGYNSAVSVTSQESLRSAITVATNNLEEGPHFVEIRVRSGVRKDLGRPTTTPKQNKVAFMSRLKMEHGIDQEVN